MEGMGWIPAILMVTFLVKKNSFGTIFSVIYKLYMSIFDACGKLLGAPQWVQRHSFSRLSRQCEAGAMANAEDVSTRQISTRWGRLLKVHIVLPSGRSETISVLRCGTVVDLKIAAQHSLGQCFLRLASSNGHLLDPADPLRLYGLQNGDSITAVAQQPKIAATRRAFALWCDGGNIIVTWGDPERGGDSSTVQHQLRNVQHVSGKCDAFAAILADGSVVTWGNPNRGGDSSRVQDQLRNVQQISATGYAFGRWIRGDLGRTRMWWWQLQSPRSAQECPADFCHGVCFCCNFGRWNRGDLGRSRMWWWQLEGPRSAQECPADFCHGVCFCCTFGRWKRGDLGRSKPWRWQLQGPRSVQLHIDPCQGENEEFREGTGVGCRPVGGPLHLDAVASLRSERAFRNTRFVFCVLTLRAPKSIRVFMIFYWLLNNNIADCCWFVYPPISLFLSISVFCALHVMIYSFFPGGYLINFIYIWFNYQSIPVQWLID